MRSVLSSENLQTKREFQDLSFRLLKMREEMQGFFASIPDVQRDVTRGLDATAALMARVDSLDSSTIETLKMCEGHIEQLVRQMSNALEYYAPHEHEQAARAVRMLEKIVVKLRNHEDAINKRGFSRNAA